MALEFLLLIPPLIIRPEELREGFALIDKAFDEGRITNREIEYVTFRVI
jgi:hypothetical protein